MSVVVAEFASKSEIVIVIIATYYCGTDILLHSGDGYTILRVHYNCKAYALQVAYDEEWFVCVC